MANPHHPLSTSDDAPTRFTDKYFREKYEDIDSAIRNNKWMYLLEQAKNPDPVNISRDPLLSIVVAYGKSDLAIQLISVMPTESVMAANYNGDTALHVAAAKGDFRVVTPLVDKNPELLEARNKQQEIPLHKAALYGQTEVFWTLVHKNSPVNARRYDGTTMLHCAVMGMAPELAFQIAEKYKYQMLSCDMHAVTPLQSLVTIPELFRSQLRLSSLESLIYEFVPLEERHQSVQGDEEELSRLSTNDRVSLHFAIVRWARLLTFNIIKQLSPRIRYLQSQKEKHKQTMDLIDYLAKDPDYWNFLVEGRSGPEGESMVSNSSLPAKTPSVSSNHEDDANLTGTNSNIKDSKTTRWNDSPLALAAKMGIHEFVERILIVYPQSIEYPDSEGMNILQVAIKHGHEKIVDIIVSKTLRHNSILPSWLLSSKEKNTLNTILHFAAEKRVDGDQGSALQMQFELQWFERVKKLVPKELVYSRNNNAQTAQELFTENHKKMVENGKTQLMEVGKTCSSLVAAVVFASSFSIPGDKDSNNNPIFVHKIAFKVFSHAYVLGLSCASTALVLFLSLLTSSYKEQDFRRALPTTYFCANISFFFALVALLVSFSCNIYLNIYGGRKAGTGDIGPMVGELTIIPAICFLLWLFPRSFSFSVPNYLRRVLS